MNLNERHSRWFDAFPRICQSNSIVVKGDFPTSHVWVPEGRPIISYYSPLLHSHCFFHVRRMTDRMEQEISETALSNHVVHPSQGDWSTENWRSFVKAYITWLDMCIYFLYIFLCMHTLTHMMWFWLYYNILFYIHLSRGSWHTELPPVDFWGFLWHHALARHMEPQPLLSYASKVPCWKSETWEPAKSA